MCALGVNFRRRFAVATLLAAVACTAVADGMAAKLPVAAAKQATAANKTTMELVIFKALPGVSDDQMVAAARSVNPLLEALTGFIGRDFGKTVETGEWVDSVMWSSLQDALNAAKNVSSNPAFQPFGSLMEPASIQMRHIPLAFGAK